MIIDFAPAAVQSDPADIDPTDYAPGGGPAPDDASWWAAHCDHAGWPRDGELSPDEQDMEIDHAEIRERAREAMEQDWIERYAVC